MRETYTRRVNAIYALGLIVGLVICVGILALPTWARWMPPA
jgi:hypothetical protein